MWETAGEDCKDWKTGGEGNLKTGKLEVKNWINWKTKGEKETGRLEVKKKLKRLEIWR